MSRQLGGMRRLSDLDQVRSGRPRYSLRSTTADSDQNLETRGFSRARLGYGSVSSYNNEVSLMKFPTRGAALALALTLAAAACSDSASDSSTEASSETTVAAVEESVEAGTIVDVASDAGSFATLLAAADAAGLVDTLNGEGPFTVFAPTDDAFAAALTDLGLTADELLASDDLAGILTYHVVPGNVLAADVIGLDGQSVATVNGAEVAITIDGDTVMVDNATVTATDVIASNGVIHVIDNVLIPRS